MDTMISHGDSYPNPMVPATVNDQRFLINFIIKTYLGPDVKTDVPRKSISQIIVEGHDSYSLSDLGTAFINISEVEDLYYYVLRNAHRSAVFKRKSLHLYLKGTLSRSHSRVVEDDKQFTSFFPIEKHSQVRYKTGRKILRGIVMIENPDISCINSNELDRFTRLTGLKDLKIDRHEIRIYNHVTQKHHNESEILCPPMSSTKNQINPITNGDPSSSGCKTGKRKYFVEPLQMKIPTEISIGSPLNFRPPMDELIPVNSTGSSKPTLVVQVPGFDIDKRNSTSVILTGTAKEAMPGPPVGLVDLGISKNAYLFRVALPGVKKDQSQFNCDIYSDGKVVISGVTITGEKCVVRHSRLFQMQTQHLCPPGPFTVSFNLPGPVDPRLFSSTFGSEGLLEAVVMKYVDRRNIKKHT